jgi:hypothetical protein
MSLLQAICLLGCQVSLVCSLHRVTHPWGLPMTPVAGGAENQHGTLTQPRAGRSAPLWPLPFCPTSCPWWVCTGSICSMPTHGLHRRTHGTYNTSKISQSAEMRIRNVRGPAWFCVMLFNSVSSLGKWGCFNHRFLIRTR